MWVINCKKAGYENKIILHDFTLKFNTNEKIALVGKNGVGKSTFVQLMLGIIPECEWEISYNNRSIETYEELRNLLGVVFQFPDDQFIGSTVREELLITAHNFGKTTSDVEKLITSFNLKDLLMYSPLELSGGQKQIIAFIVTLLSEPKLLLLDEATSMLDPIAKQKFLEQVIDYQEQNEIALVHITHDFRELSLFDQITYLSNGKITFSGNYQEFMEQIACSTEELLPLDLRIANKLYKLGKIAKIPTSQTEWEEVAWVLKSVI